MIETVTPRMPTAPENALPDGACDAHTHVFGPYDRFPFTEPSNYPPPLAPVALHLAMLDSVAARRGIIVQPAPYGTDRGAMLDAITQSQGRLRGVSVATADTSEQVLSELVASGICGLRFVEMRDPKGSPFKGSVGFDALRKLGPKMKAVGLHAELWANCSDHVAAIPELLAHQVPLVLDHMGSFDPSRGLNDSAFQQMLTHLSKGEIWIKLTLCRTSKKAPSYADLHPFHDSLVAANPDRLIWGSDWPYVRMGDAAPDVGQMIDLFTSWVSDPSIRRKILVENPARLYGFDLPS